MITRETWTFRYLVSIQTPNEGLIGLSCIWNRARYVSLSFLSNQQTMDSFQNDETLNAEEQSLQTHLLSLFFLPNP